jgi:hypothetical protein
VNNLLHESNFRQYAVMAVNKTSPPLPPLCINNHNHQFSTVILIPWLLQSSTQLPAKVICTTATSSSVIDRLPYLLYWPRLDRPKDGDELHY